LPFSQEPADVAVSVFTYWIAAALLARSVTWARRLYRVAAGVFSELHVMCAVIERGGMLRPALLFAGFRSGRPPLVALGVLYLPVDRPGARVASFEDAGALMKWSSPARSPIEAFRDGSVSRAMLVADPGATPVVDGFLVCARARGVEPHRRAFNRSLQLFRSVAETGGRSSCTEPQLALAGAVLVVALAIAAFWCRERYRC